MTLLQGKPTPVTFTWQGETVTAQMASPWTPDDVAAALAVQAAEADACPGCGVDLEVSTDKEHQFSWEVEDVRCFNCQQRHKVLEQYDDRSGLMVRSRFAPDERMQG